MAGNSLENKLTLIIINQGVETCHCVYKKKLLHLVLFVLVKNALRFILLDLDFDLLKFEVFSFVLVFPLLVFFVKLILRFLSLAYPILPEVVVDLGSVSAENSF